MIYIQDEQVNTFALTLTENATISEPYFLFKFQWEFDMTSSPIYWVGTDTSPYPERYNLFTLEEGVDLDLRFGQYTYTVYESPIDITVDENTTEEDLNELEEGRMVVEGTTTTIYE